MNRGVGAAFLNLIVQMGMRAGNKVRADFLANDRNRIMYLTFKMCGFRELHSNGNEMALHYESCVPPVTPDWLKIKVSDYAQFEGLPAPESQLTRERLP